MGGFPSFKWLFAAHLIQDGRCWDVAPYKELIPHNPYMVLQELIYGSHKFLTTQNDLDGEPSYRWPHPMHVSLATYQHCHDDVIKWKHFPRYWPFVRGIHRSPVKSPHKGQWRGAFVFSLICAWINRLVNDREAGDLRRYRPHFDVIVMVIWLSKATPLNDYLPLEDSLYMFVYSLLIIDTNIQIYSNLIITRSTITWHILYMIWQSTVCTCRSCITRIFIFHIIMC